MRKVWLVNIEPLEERYSAQWLTWFKRVFEQQKVQYDFVLGTALTSKIENGSFLDVVSTNHYKASQLMKLTALIKEGHIKDDDVVFFFDAWFPGMEMLQYIRQGMGLKFKMSGIFHAGTYDKNDFLYKKGMEPWGSKLETAWLEMLDFVFLATQYHKDILKVRNPKAAKKMFVTGLPFDKQELVPFKADVRRNWVVFPHRLDSEKRPDLFDDLAKACARPGWTFIKSKKLVDTKNGYYRLLSAAKIAVSFAEQETFGYAMIEAALGGCELLVPNAVSYKEMYPAKMRMKSFSQYVMTLRTLMKRMEGRPVERTWYPWQIDGAIERMIDILRRSYAKVDKGIEKEGRAVLRR